MRFASVVLALSATFLAGSIRVDAQSSPCRQPSDTSAIVLMGLRIRVAKVYFAMDPLRTAAEWKPAAVMNLNYELIAAFVQ